MTQPPNVTFHHQDASGAATIRRPDGSETAWSGEAPSQTVSRAANATATRIDKRGRKIVVRRFNALQFFRLTKILGAGTDNSATMNLAMTAASVCQIDEDVEFFPHSPIALDAIIQRLDFDGLEAAGDALKELSDDQGLESAKN
jgi:hypothetical protein